MATGSDDAVDRAVPIDSFQLCGGCEPAKACKLGLVFPLTFDQDGVRSVVVCPTTWQGGPGMAHGGWIASLFDDLLGRLANVGGAMRVTRQLDTTFVRPVPVEQELMASAWHERSAGRDWFAAGRLVQVDTGKVLAEVHAHFVDVDRDRYRRAEEWLRQQRETTADDGG
jgi:acyl-coenzyme A thioesterase PaaI-like protein